MENLMELNAEKLMNVAGGRVISTGAQCALIDGEVVDL